MKNKPYSVLIVVFSIIVCCVASLSCSRPETKRYWLMDKPCPTNCVPVWFPGDNADHQLCEITNASPALALASVLTVIQEVNEHKIHYHVRYEDGVLLTEYLADPKSKTGERRLERDEVIHLHGVYVDLETAKELITTVKSHQHGAE